MTSSNVEEQYSALTQQDWRKFHQIESCIKEHLLSICNLGTEEIRGRPSLDHLKQRVDRAYHPDEAQLLLAYIEEREHDEDAFWKELNHFHQQLKSRGEHVIEEPQPLDKGFHELLKLLARAEVEQLVETRLRLRAKKQWERDNDKKKVNFFDSNDHMERALEMAETLPLGSRGVQAPHEGFLKLGKKVAGADADAERQLFFALLLEEFAIEQLQPYISELPNAPRNDVSWYAVPPSMAYIREMMKVSSQKGEGSGEARVSENGVNYGTQWPPQAAQVRLMNEELGVAFGPRLGERQSKKSRE